MPDTGDGAGFIMLARFETGGLIKPKGPTAPSEDLVFSPFIGMSPPSLLGPGRGGLKQLTETPHAPTLEAPYSPAAQGQPKGLIPAVAVETPPDQPPPILPPAPPVIPDPPPPAPPVVVVVVAPTSEQPPPGPPPPEARPTPVQSLVAPTQLAAVAAVPEPGTWSMLILGFGAIGAALRRRRRERPVAEGAC
ncbi:MAG: PEPxxWA-CTERM sorting domain-containing protein [Phenylobacterium sp.]